MNSEVFDLAPPNAVASERALLAGFLDRGRVDPDCDLRAEQFYDGRNGAIYNAMSDLEAELGAWDTTALIACLQSDPLWGENGFDAAYVAETLTAAGNPAIGAHHSRQIKQAWRRRTVAAEAERLLQLSHDGFDVDALQATLGKINGVVSEEAKSPDPRFQLVSSTALDSADYAPTPLITEALFAGIPAVIGAPFKTCKTLVGIDGAMSIATGRPWLGAFTIPEPRSVVYFSGEGGPCVAQEYGRRIAASKGITLADVAQLRWCFTVPRLEDSRDLEEFCRVLDQTPAEVVFLDNLMLCLSGDKAGVVFYMGGVLGNVIRLCGERGVTPVFIHHFKRNRQDQFAPGELADLTQAGVAEIAGQWWLLTRSELYSPERPGEHRLWLSIGGRVGHSSLHALDVHEGSRADPGGRRWDVGVREPDEVRNETSYRREATARAKQEECAENDKQKVLGAMAALERDHPEGSALTSIRDRSCIRGKRLEVALSKALGEGLVVVCKFSRSNHKTPISGYRLNPERGAK